MDRCHRIGQTRPVVVYRLVTRHSVEDRLLNRAQSKRKLEKLVVHKGSFRGMHRQGVVLDLVDIRRLLDEKEQLEVSLSLSHSLLLCVCLCVTVV